MSRNLVACLLLMLTIPACARDDARCHTHKTSNGDLTECSRELAETVSPGTGSKEPA
ncbi:hypothetical protein FHT98_0558 [Bosea sp. AK1]|uniref:hypothetical protein n=1 Tax=Bosea sp. AK1 TaxID=2587160 RepID=UPI00116F7BB1|nr:hypothetical protein [Bosea sp. AK1]TQI72840.1 hypothetical protein FHT98_0558 [Bosea sp. AK1]